MELVADAADEARLEAEAATEEARLEAEARTEDTATDAEDVRDAMMEDTFGITTEVGVGTLISMLDVSCSLFGCEWLTERRQSRQEREQQ